MFLNDFIARRSFSSCGLKYFLFVLPNTFLLFIGQGYAAFNLNLEVKKIDSFFSASAELELFVHLLYCYVLASASFFCLIIIILQIKFTSIVSSFCVNYASSRSVYYYVLKWSENDLHWQVKEVSLFHNRMQSANIYPPFYFFSYGKWNFLAYVFCDNCINY